LTTALDTLNPFRYRGYVYDEETGLYYLRSRYYNPEWGRFLNADAVLGQAGALLSHNLFGYCVNNPVNRDDPSGLMPGSPFEWDESPWYYSDVINPSRREMIVMNNGYKTNGKVSRKKTPGEGYLYIPVLNATFMVHWNSIGTYHLDLYPSYEGKEKIVEYWGFSMTEHGTKKQWVNKNAWGPVTAYLLFKGKIVAGSVNLMLHSGSGESAKLNVKSGNICFYTYDSGRGTGTTVKRHREVADEAYIFARSVREYLVIDE